ncbi:hypothetical protein F947_01522 [Acinetobacter towneri DSM 14962 = CIP 107472]|nr:hypothetical protein F947_01522 [Acinetobacter towneri DSM 14962 = CIP 107472]
MYIMLNKISEDSTLHLAVQIMTIRVELIE